MSANTHDLVIFAVVVALRLFVPLAIPRFPLPAIIAAMIIDAADQTIFQNYTTLNLDWYQGYDKSLDIYYLAIAYVATMRNWTNLHAFGVGRFLWYYRLIGVVLFEILQIRALLFIFANTFEYFFDFIEGVRTRWNPRRLSLRHVIYAAAFIWIFIKLPQEYWIHIAQLDTTDFIRENIFDVPVDTPWGTIISDNIPFFIGLIALLIGLILLVRWVFRNKLPAPDWGWTFDADSHRETDPAYAGQAALAGQKANPETRVEKILNNGLLEKFVLLTLITGLFGIVLPGIEFSNVRLAIAVAVIVIANMIVSEFFSRRGMSFDTAMKEFLLVALTNIGLVVIYHFFTRGEEARLKPGEAIFFLFLISIIIAMYDAYRPIYLRRVAAENAQAGAAA